MPFESAQGFEKEVPPRIVKLTFTNLVLRTQGFELAAGSPLKRDCAAARNAVRKGNALRITRPVSYHGTAGRTHCVKST